MLSCWLDLLYTSGSQSLACALLWILISCAKLLVRHLPGLPDLFRRPCPGVTRMKAIARSYMCWPGLDKVVEELVRNSIPCQSNRHNPAPAPLHPWTWPSQPWQRVHFAIPFLGRMFLVAVDVHSKWLGVVEMSSTTTTKLPVSCITCSLLIDWQFKWSQTIVPSLWLRSLHNSKI